jgi:hypothetical protein
MASFRFQADEGSIEDRPRPLKAFEVSLFNEFSELLNFRVIVTNEIKIVRIICEHALLQFSQVKTA